VITWARGQLRRGIFGESWGVALATLVLLVVWYGVNLLYTP